MKTILHWSLWVLIAAALVGTLRAGKVFADPFISAEAGGVRITVYSEDCQIKEVANLQKRAVWTENGKTVEGCAGFFPELQMVFFYWADKTVVGVPASYFQRVTGA